MSQTDLTRAEETEQQSEKKGDCWMNKVFIYWDNSNIFHEAQRLAEQQDEEPDARYRVRIHFENLLRLAHADRTLQKAYAVGSVPPEMRSLWNRMEAHGVEVDLFDRGDPARGEQQMPDHMLQLQMLTDALDYNGTPGIVTLLTGDGAGYFEGAGFHRTLGTDAQTRVEGRNPFVEAFVQAADAALGRDERGVRRARRLL